VIAYAAVDLREGRVVQLVGGRPEAERVSLEDPAGVTRGWVDAGFRALHVIDLDAALGTGSNEAGVAAVVEAAAPATVQAGGGVRTTERAAALFDAGAARVVVGTRAVQDRAWLTDLAERWPQRIVVAADVVGDEVVINGWTRTTGIAAADFLAGLDGLPLAAVLVTDVSREGRMIGADTERVARLVSLSPHPLLAAGGIGSADDLVGLAAAGAAGAVLGMALYTGALDPRSVAQEYST
jgi:phosphoribosylformimino-5-aminoimidazole carboxamide ribotide isomerase